MNGLKYNQVKHYWQTRSSHQKELTVGFGGNRSLAAQDDEYKVKTSFVEQYIDKDLPTIDFGCGTGRWSQLFNNYIGVDITENLLNIARENHSNKKFILAETPVVPAINFRFSQFFTSTVLQHCDDNLVFNIIQSLHNIKQNNLSIILYENSQVQVDHVNGRSSETYKNMFSTCFEIKSFQFDSHTVHNEEHNITKILV